MEEEERSEYYGNQSEEVGPIVRYGAGLTLTGLGKTEAIIGAG